MKLREPTNEELCMWRNLRVEHPSEVDGFLVYYGEYGDKKFPLKLQKGRLVKFLRRRFYIEYLQKDKWKVEEFMEEMSSIPCPKIGPFPDVMDRNYREKVNNLYEKKRKKWLIKDLKSV